MEPLSQLCISTWEKFSRFLRDVISKVVDALASDTVSQARVDAGGEEVAGICEARTL